MNITQICKDCEKLKLEESETFLIEREPTIEEITSLTLQIREKVSDVIVRIEYNRQTKELTVTLT